MSISVKELMIENNKLLREQKAVVITESTLSIGIQEYIKDNYGNLMTVSDAHATVDEDGFYMSFEVYLQNIEGGSACARFVISGPVQYRNGYVTINKKKPFLNLKYKFRKIGKGRFKKETTDRHQKTMKDIFESISYQNLVDCFPF